MLRQTVDDSLLQADLTNSPTRLQLRVEARHSFSFGIFLETWDEHRVNITGCVITFTANKPVHKGGGFAFDKVADIVDGPNGHAQLNLQAADLDLAAAQYELNITLLTPAGYSSPLTKGYLEVVANPDPGYVDEVYTEANPPDSITAKILENHTVAIVVNHLAGLALVAAPVTMLAPGEPATARIVGDYPYQILELGIPAGGDGGGGGPAPPVAAEDLGKVWVQSVAASIWNISHELMFRPNVTVVDSAGDEVEGDVRHLNATSIRITFSAAFAGTAYLS
jgi:hypothetical protein